MAHLPETIAAQIPEFAQCRSPNIEDNPDDLLTRIGRTPASARTCGQSGFNREIRILGCNFDSSDFLEIQPLFLRMWWTAGGINDRFAHGSISSRLSRSVCNLSKWKNYSLGSCLSSVADGVASHCPTGLTPFGIRFVG